MDVSVSWVLKNLQLQHLTLWLLRDEICAVQTKVYILSLSGSGRG